MFDPKFKGDLVKLSEYAASFSPSRQSTDSLVGVVIDRWLRWPEDSYEDEVILKILFTDTGEEEEWSEWDVELISENR